MSKHENDDLTPASNFELNVMKIGKHRFQLEKGDRFSSNGHTFLYHPKGSENRSKLPMERFHKHTSISVKKYQKDVEKAENIKLIKDEPYYTGDDPRAKEEYNVRNRIREWEVQSAYTIPVHSEEPLVSMVLEINSFSDGKWKYTVKRHEIERNTKETYFLKQHQPVTYLSRLPKTDLNTPKGGNHTFHIIGEFDDYHDLEIKLFKYAEEQQLYYIQNAKDHLKKEEENLSKFLKAKVAQGFPA